MADVNAPEFWEELYAGHRDGWEMGVPHPSLVRLVDTTSPPRGRIAVPGCGRGHDARFLAARGYDVVGFDFAPAALEGRVIWLDAMASTPRSSSATSSRSVTTTSTPSTGCGSTRASAPSSRAAGASTWRPWR